MNALLRVHREIRYLCFLSLCIWFENNTIFLKLIKFWSLQPQASCMCCRVIISVSWLCNRLWSCLSFDCVFPCLLASIWLESRSLSHSSCQRSGYFIVDSRSKRNMQFALSFGMLIPFELLLCKLCGCCYLYKYFISLWTYSIHQNHIIF